jgi:hypothetical protein
MYVTLPARPATLQRSANRRHHACIPKMTNKAATQGGLIVQADYETTALNGASGRRNH